MPILWVMQQWMDFESVIEQIKRPSPGCLLPQAPLMPFDATGRTPWAMPFGWQDYAELVDWTGRRVPVIKDTHLVDSPPPAF